MGQNRFPDSALSVPGHAFAITPNDATPLGIETKAIFVGTGGDITLRARDSSADVVLKNIAAGQVIRLNVAYVRAAGTDADDLVGFA